MTTMLLMLIVLGMTMSGMVRSIKNDPTKAAAFGAMLKRMFSR